MKLAKKLLLGYLAVTSILLHLVLIAMAPMFIQAMREGWNMADEINRAQQGQAANRAIIKDVSVLKDGDYTCTGYALEYQGKPLYAAGFGQEFKVGDQVALAFQRHPFPSHKTMTVMVLKVGR